MEPFVVDAADVFAVFLLGVVVGVWVGVGVGLGGIFFGVVPEIYYVVYDYLLEVFLVAVAVFRVDVVVRGELVGVVVPLRVDYYVVLPGSVVAAAVIILILDIAVKMVRAHWRAAVQGISTKNSRALDHFWRNL